MAESKPRVHGLGGVFFKAADPQGLAAWYAEHLGLPAQAWGGAIFQWQRIDGDNPTTGPRGYTVWAPFKDSTTCFAPSDKPFMLNFRVDDLEGTLAALRAEGCNVLDRREDSEQGHFGYVLDPEGHLVELWQPNPSDATPIA